MPAHSQARRLSGLILIAIGLGLIAIYMTQIDQSARSVAITSTFAPIDRSTPIASASPTIEPANTIEAKPTATLKNKATATFVLIPLPTKSVATAMPRSTAVSTPLPTKSVATAMPRSTAVSTPLPTKSIATATPHPAVVSTPTPLPPSVNQGLDSTRRRIGIGVSYVKREVGRLQDLRPGFYLTWGLSAVSQPAGVSTFTPMVRLFKGQPALALSTYTNYAQQHPGRLWLIGNEPDVIWQDNSTPAEYAAAYHTLYSAIKAADPTSRIAIAGVSQPTPLRLQYLEQILAAYQDQFGEPMPIDVWNIHNFILNEERGSWGIGIPPGLAVDRGQLSSIDQHDDLKIFRQQIVNFRRWMAAHGFRDKELIVSEYGILMPVDYGFDYARVRDFMLGSFDFFLTATDNSIGLPADGNRLVQTWCWYSLSDQEYPAGNLVDYQTGDILALGRDFINYLQTH
jgi:hypothetical protein